jgi:hypothetical protein
MPAFLLVLNDLATLYTLLFFINAQGKFDSYV